MLHYLFTVSQLTQDSEDPSVQKFEKARRAYSLGDCQTALEQLSVLGADYSNGYFLTQAVQNGDEIMLKELIGKGAKVSVSHFQEAACAGWVDCLELLLDQVIGRIDPVTLRQTVRTGSDLDSKRFFLNDPRTRDYFTEDEKNRILRLKEGRLS